MRGRSQSQESDYPAAAHSLGWRELPVFLYAWFGLLRVIFWLRWRNLAWVCRRLQRRSGASPPSMHPPLTFLQRLSCVVNSAAAYAPFPTTCLARSLFLWGWLRQLDVPANLRLGVRKQAGTLLAHAWVEYAGVVLNDDAAHVAQYTPFDPAEADSLPDRGWF
ncbi:MAG: hypothetical protein Fur0021_13490 [Candidatus Promineifilaceae bacterium]